MRDYSVLASDKSKSFGTFDTYRAAATLYKKLDRTKSVNLISLHACGCSFRAIVKGNASPKGCPTRKSRKHRGWRRAEVCSLHIRFSKSISQVENDDGA